MEGRGTYLLTYVWLLSNLLHVWRRTTNIPSIYLWAVMLSAGLCNELSDPENGNVNVTRAVDTGVTEGSIAAHTCNIGYQLIGEDQTRTCMSNGKWSGEEPTCIRMKNALPIYIYAHIRRTTYELILFTNLNADTYTYMHQKEQHTKYKLRTFYICRNV